MRNRHRKFWIIALVLFFFIAGIPIIINESYKLAYKIGVLYVTMWEAPDVLSYYGAVLGASIAVTTLVITILFTRRQIQRESYLAQQKEKWTNIRGIFVEGIDNISPIKPLLVVSEKRSDVLWTIEQLQKYMYACETVIDKLQMHLNSDEDYPKVQHLIANIIRNANAYRDLTSILYSSCAKQARCDEEMKLLDNLSTLNANRFHGELDEYIKELVGHICGNVKHYDEHICAFTEYKAGMEHEYETSYQDMLKLIGSTFDKIEKDIQIEADNMLNFWGKSHADT